MWVSVHDKQGNTAGLFFLHVSPTTYKKATIQSNFSNLKLFRGLLLVNTKSDCNSSEVFEREMNCLRDEILQGQSQSSNSSQFPKGNFPYIPPQ
jgi:hypothetical protein